MSTKITLSVDFVRALMLKGDKRRNLLRQMATPLIQSLDEDKLVAAAKQNERVANGDINPRLTYSGIRDQMTITALSSLITGFQPAPETITAIAVNLNPVEFGLFWRDNGSTKWDDPYYALSSLLRAIAEGKAGDARAAIDHMKAVNSGNTWEVVEEKPVQQVIHDYKDDDDSDTVTNGQPAAASGPAVNLPTVDPSKLAICNTVLSSVGISPYEEIVEAFHKLETDLTNAKTGPKGMSIKYEFVGQPNLAGAKGIPQGKMVMKRAFDVFGITTGKEQFDFDVPTFQWDAPHPYVEAVDPDYQFQPVPLLRLLWALVTNQKAWLHGHTGTGKSTLVEQVSARTGWPMVRINFDSEITRMDLIGRDKLTSSSSGQPVTTFEDGILPKAMQMPCILLCDEMDFIRPDVAYVMQRALENKGLLITEDGGRLIKPDPMFRIVATANTKGNGDDTGRYMGARPQSGAFLDRYTCWIEVDYMTPPAVAKLIEAKKPGIDKDAVKVLRDYAKEHWVGFKNGDIQQPLSPRGLLASAEAYTFLSGVMPKGEAIKQAIATTISERCSESDAQTIQGLVQRVM